MNLYFEKKISIQEDLKSRQLISKGFHKQTTIQDFPLKGMFVFFQIRRRRWTDNELDHIVQRNWNLVASETRQTKEFEDYQN